MLSKLVGSVSQALDFNAATLSGSIDIIVVPQDDGSLKSTPFHVRFGKGRVLRSRDKVVEVIVNDVTTDIRMTLGSAGEAYFTKQTDAVKEDLQLPPVIAGNESPINLQGREAMNLPFTIEYSMCGHLLQGGSADTSLDEMLFENNKLDYDQMCMHPEFWFHDALTVRMDCKHPYYPAKAVIPILSSMAAFNQFPTTQSVLTAMANVVTATPLSGYDKAQQLDLYNLEKKTGRTFRYLPDPATIESLTWSLCCPEKDEDEQEVTAVPARNVVIEPEEPAEDEMPKTLRPSAEQLAAMNLQLGENDIKFRLAGTTSVVRGKIFLWEKNAKIVVSDVDGTITRSDVWGQLAPLVGRDWTHDGIHKYMRNIEKNGYKLLYLTARAIGQADTTRSYIFQIDSNNQTDPGVTKGLPGGPLILSPDRLFSSFKREVIDRTPYVFKIAALKDIRNLFPSSRNPFYAGFGNRDTDHKAYVEVGIPEGKVFIVDHLGSVCHLNSAYASTYADMSVHTDMMFPGLKKSVAGVSEIPESPKNHLWSILSNLSQSPKKVDATFTSLFPNVSPADDQWILQEVMEETSMTYSENSSYDSSRTSQSEFIPNEMDTPVSRDMKSHTIPSKKVDRLPIDREPIEKLPNAPGTAEKSKKKKKQKQKSLENTIIRLSSHTSSTNIAATSDNTPIVTPRHIRIPNIGSIVAKENIKKQSTPAT